MAHLTQPDALVAEMKRSELAELMQQTIAKQIADISATVTTQVMAAMSTLIETRFTEIQNALEAQFKADMDSLKLSNSKLSNENVELHKQCGAMDKGIHQAITAANDVESYGRRWLIRLHGVPVPAPPPVPAAPDDAAGVQPVTRSRSQGRQDPGTDHQQRRKPPSEDCIATCLDIFKSKLGINNITADDIEAAHRLGPRTDGKPPSIIARFVRRNKKQIVMTVRKDLKKSGISISDDITKLNMQLLNRVNNSDLISTAWSFNGTIYGIPKGSAHKIRFALFKSVQDCIADATRARQVHRE